DRQPEAGAAELARARRIDLAERLEDPLVVLGGDADAGIAHRELYAAGGRARRDRHATALGELERVRDEILEDLAEPKRVGLDRLGQAGRCDEAELEPLLRGDRREGVAQVVELAAQRDRLGPHVE